VGRGFTGEGGRVGERRLAGEGFRVRERGLTGERDVGAGALGAEDADMGFVELEGLRHAFGTDGGRKMSRCGHGGLLVVVRR
jgi:hypothetical protein